MNTFHTPVLLQKIIEYLSIEKGKKYIDGTIGGGGHGFEILKRGGVVLGIDCDQEAIDYVSRRWKIESRRWNIIEGNLILIKGNFREIDKIAHLNGFSKVAGIIFDLGVSSHQLEVAERGFSFLRDGPLDMRMDKDLTVQAKDLIQVLTKGELYELFSKVGEESCARSVSEHIISARKIKPITTTQDLVRIIEKAKRSGRFLGIHPATLVFQALRIAVNDELNALREALPKAGGLLEKNGRLLVISFHSLEDRVVKKSFIEFQKRNMGVILTKTPILPSIREISKNKRARSAKLRVFEAYSGHSTKLGQSPS